MYVRSTRLQNYFGRIVALPNMRVKTFGKCCKIVAYTRIWDVPDDILPNSDAMRIEFLYSAGISRSLFGPAGAPYFQFQVDANRFQTADRFVEIF